MIKMNNLSLMNTETSINFDGHVIQSREEAEYRKEEEQQQNELKGLLKDAFDDLIDDDLLSVTSEDSANISGCSESKTPIKNHRRNGDHAQSGLPSRDQVARELDAVANGMQHATLTGTYDVDKPVLKNQPSHTYHPGNYTGHTSSIDSIPDLQQRFNSCGIREHTDAANHYGSQTIPDSEEFHLGNEHVHLHTELNDQWHGKTAGYVQDNEHPQIHPPHLHHFQFHDPQYTEHYDERFHVNRIIEGREREEAEGGNDVMFTDAQGQTQWSHTHEVGYGQTDELQIGNSLLPSHTAAYSYGRDYDIPRSEGHYVQPMQNMDDFNDNGFRRQINPELYQTDESNNIALNHPRHISIPTSHFISAEPGSETTGPHTHSEFQDNYKVEYRHSKTCAGDASSKLNTKETLTQQGPQRTDDSQKEFISQDNSDGGQLAQMQILYKARGRKLEELTHQLEIFKQEQGRELRILKHQLSMAQAEKEGIETSHKQCQELLQDTKGENSTLAGKLRAAEAQIANLKEVKEDLVQQIQTTESTIESLTEQVADLSHSDSLARARNDHNTVVSSMQQRHDQEVFTLKQSLDTANNKLSEQEHSILLLKKQLTEQTHLTEQAQISRAENINRLNKSLEESQRQCQALLESASSQELGQIKIQLSQATASKKISDEMCTSLQSEIKELKDQLSMYESASSLGVFSRGQSLGVTDDSMLDLGIKRTLDFNTPDSISRIGRTHGTGEITARLKNELERCVTSNSQKRAQNSKLKEELRMAKEEIVKLKERCHRAEKSAEEFQKRLKEFEDLMQPGNKMSAMESRMNKEMDNLKRERAILLEDIEELKKRLTEVGKSEESLSEINQEVNKQMSDMVKDYDTDKREALERCQRACDQVHEVSKQKLRRELTSEFSIERAQIVTRYESQIGQLRSELSSAQQEIDEVKDLYIKACAENNTLGEKFREEFEEKHKDELAKIKAELSSEKEKEVEKAIDENTETLTSQVKERMKEEYAVTLNREVEAKVASMKVEWMEELKQSKDSAVEDAVTAARRDWTVKHEAMFESEVENRVEAAKSKWMAEKQLAFYSELQTEKAKWQLVADARLEEEIDKAVNHARELWQNSAADNQNSEHLKSNDEIKSSNLQEEFEERVREKVKEELESCMETEKVKWQLETDIKLEKEIRNQIKVERTRWLFEHEHQIEVEVELALKKAKNKWSMSADEQKKISEKDHLEIMENEKLRWQRESSVLLKEEVKKAVESCQRDLERKLQERRQQDEDRFLEKMKSEKDNWMKEADGRLQEEITRVSEQEQMQVGSSAFEDGVLREEMNLKIQSEVSTAVENARLEWQKHSTSDVTVSLLEQELESIKSENNKLKSELRSKEHVWIEKRDALLAQKDAERRQCVSDVQDQCQQDYQQFITEHQDMLNQALKETRDKHALEKMQLQQSYDEKLEELQSEKLLLQQDLRNREILSPNNSRQENCLLNVSLDMERQVWQKERHKLKKSVANREKLLQSADSHMANEMEKLKGELEDAYQTQLTAAVANVEADRESLMNQVSDKQKYVQQLEEEYRTLRTSIASTEASHKQEIMSHKQEITSHKQKQQELNSQLKKAEKFLQDAQNHYQREQQAAEAESEEAMQNMKRKMVEIRNSHAAAVEALKKHHSHEKRDLVKQLKKFTDRTLTSTSVQTDDWDEFELMELRGQYIETVRKIKEDVMQHTTQANLRAAETVKESISQNRLVNVKQLKNFYRNSVRKILQNELTGAELESKLAAIDQALEQLTISLCSSRSTTPTDLDNSRKSSCTSGSILIQHSCYSHTGSEFSSQDDEDTSRPGLSEHTARSYNSSHGNITAVSFQPLDIDMTDSLDESQPMRDGSNSQALATDSSSDRIAVRCRPPRHSNNDMLQLTDSPNNCVTLRPSPRQAANDADNKLRQRKTFEDGQSDNGRLNQVSNGSEFSRDSASEKELKLELPRNQMLRQERFTRAPPKSKSPTFVTKMPISNGTSQVTKSMEDEFITPKLTTFQPRLSKAKSELTLNKFGGSTGFSTAGIQINYTYTPLNQSITKASPSTSLLSTCSVSDGDLRLVGQHLPGDNADKDEPVLLNLQSLGLGNPSPRKFNPAPEKLEGKNRTVKSSNDLFGMLPVRGTSNTDDARSNGKQGFMNEFKEFPGRNKLQFGLVSISTDFTDSTASELPWLTLSEEKILSSPKEIQTSHSNVDNVHFSQNVAYSGSRKTNSGHRPFRMVEPDRVFNSKQTEPKPIYRETYKERRSIGDVYPRDKLAKAVRQIAPSSDREKH